ncbi:hypothetical protein CBR_g57025 [Chara braunii]|uniref:Uncharacterized protein n=1 Tax=Chara braunii TaxID=69332 RepID=A0A388K888_CHABU|nr:hypothetical protein CBR_g57025 [Chara braunii]|eukprot:GBG66143.1 hypothetical protein CBR_g57025 [Chara braunii]
MSTRAGARGKKRDIVPEDTQGRERGRRHVPKAKRVHSDDAAGSVPPRQPQGWATAVEGDDDDVFTTEEEAAEETVYAVRKSGHQCSFDHSAARRRLMPPTEAPHVHARETQSEKEDVVNLRDIARAMWYDEEWSNVVSTAVCVHTIDLSMNLPQWFAGASIEDTPEDDDMAAYQESTMICIAHGFRAAVQMGANVDSGFISHDRLSRVADCFRLLLTASMWYMRMATDDLRSHYEAFYFAKLVAKPTLITSMHHSFEHRRSVIRATHVVTERLGNVNSTLREYLKYMPEWASCGIVFGHDVSITGLEDAKRLDWLGSSPLEEENDDAGKDDA